MIARAEGKCSQHKGWWWEGKDELATHSMTTEVWISTRGRNTEATRIALQEALEEDEKKDTPSFGKEDLQEIRSGTEAGLLGIYNFPGSVYATEDPMTKASWERASLNSMNIEAAAANWAEGRKATPPTGLN